MAFQIRTMRVTAALPSEDITASRHVDGCSTRFNTHRATTCLSGLVQAFLETADCDGDDDADYGGGPKTEENGEEEDADANRAVVETVYELMWPPSEKDLFRHRLAADVSKVAESLSWLKNTGGCGASAFRRATMMRLRAAGYNAGICKAQWNGAGGISAGSYEYIDVVVLAGEGTGKTRQGKRYIVDLDFVAEFEVARATETYRSVVAALPPVVVAGEEVVRRVVREVADAARRSLRARGLHVPPWRKGQYMLAKWLGPYRRTTNPVPPTSLAAAVSDDVKCRAVGFPTAPPVAIPAARTR